MVARQTYRDFADRGIRSAGRAVSARLGGTRSSRCRALRGSSGGSDAMKNTKHEAEDDSLLNGAPYHAGLESANRNVARRNRGKWMMAGVLMLAVALALPSRAHAGIFDIFDEIFGTIQNDM